MALQFYGAKDWWGDRLNLSFFLAWREESKLIKQ